MQKRHCDARTSRFKALHGLARYVQRKLQATRNLARRGDLLQLLEAVDAASGRGGSSLLPRSSSRLAGCAEAKCTTKMTGRGRSWREGTMLSGGFRCEIDWFLKGRNSDTLDFFSFSGAPSSSWHVFVLQQESFAASDNAFFRKLRVWESREFCSSLSTGISCAAFQ